MYCFWLFICRNMVSEIILQSHTWMYILILFFSFWKLLLWISFCWITLILSSFTIFIPLSLSINSRLFNGKHYRIKKFLFLVFINIFHLCISSLRKTISSFPSFFWWHWCLVLVFLPLRNIILYMRWYKNSCTIQIQLTQIYIHKPHVFKKTQQ